MAEKCVTGTTDSFYENDLALAAELGKALLERNRDLEAQLSQLQQINSEYRLENEHLNNQLAALRDINDSRLRVYEELDRNVQELEGVNKKLRGEASANRDQIKRYAERVTLLEEDCNDLQNHLDEVKALEIKRKKEDIRKAQSVPSVQDAVFMEIKNSYRKSSNWTTNNPGLSVLPRNPFEDEINRLNKDLSRVRRQMSSERAKCGALESRLVDTMLDNQSLEKKVGSLNDDILDCRARLAAVAIEAGTGRGMDLCPRCSQARWSPRNPIMHEVEHDDPQVTSEGRFVRLADGGSLYGSDESINRVVSESGGGHETADPPNQLPFSCELSAQYGELIGEYEALIGDLTKRANCDNSSLGDLAPRVDRLHRDVQALISERTSLPPTAVNVEHSAESASYRTENETRRYSPPTYKYLFKDIYATLEKSRSIGDVTVERSHATTNPFSVESRSPIASPRRRKMKKSP